MPISTKLARNSRHPVKPAQKSKQQLSKPKGYYPLLQFLQGLDLDEVDLARKKDTGRDLNL
jgi:hypothetical protein